MLNADVYGCNPLLTGLMKPARISVLLKHEYDVNNTYIIFTYLVNKGHHLFGLQ